MENHDESYGFSMQGYYTYVHKVHNLRNRFEIHQSMRELWPNEVWKWGTLRDYGNSWWFLWLQYAGILYLCIQGTQPYKQICNSSKHEGVMAKWGLKMRDFEGLWKFLMSPMASVCRDIIPIAKRYTTSQTDLQFIKAWGSYGQMRFANKGIWGTMEIFDESYGFSMQGFYTYVHKVHNLRKRFEIHQSMRELWPNEVWKWGTLRDYGNSWWVLWLQGAGILYLCPQGTQPHKQIWNSSKHEWVMDKRGLKMRDFEGLWKFLMSPMASVCRDIIPMSTKYTTSETDLKFIKAWGSYGQMRFENEGLWGTMEILHESYGFGMQGYYTNGNKVHNLINRFEIHHSMRELWPNKVWKWGTLRDYANS